MSDVTNNRLRNVELGKLKSRTGDNIRQLGLKFNLNNEVILTEYDPLDGGDTFTGLVWDRENRTLKLQLPEGEVFLGGSEGVTTASISEIIEGSEDVGNLVRFVEDIDSLQISSLHESIKMAVVGDTLLTQPGDQAYLYAWNENSSLPHSPPSVVKPDSVEDFELGRWEIATSIPLDLDKILITVDTSSDLENYPRPQSRQQALILESDGSNPSGVYLWDSDSTTDGSGYIKPDSQQNSQTGRWVRSNNSFLVEGNNLSDLQDVSSARNNLGLGEVAVRDDNEVLLSANNLSDVNDQGSSRTNLGLGSASTQDSSEILQVNNSLSEIDDNNTQNLARQNIGMPGRDAQSFDDAGAGVYRESHFLHATEEDEAEAKITFIAGLEVNTEPLIVGSSANSTFEGGVTVNTNDLDVNANATFGDSVIIEGTGNLNVNANASFSSNVIIEGTGNLDVNAIASFSSNVIIEGTGDLDVNAIATFEDNVTIEETGSLSVNSSATFNGNVDISNGVDFTVEANNFTVEANTTFNNGFLEPVTFQNNNDNIGLSITNGSGQTIFQQFNVDSSDTVREFHIDNYTRGLVRLGNYETSFSVNPDGSLTHEYRDENYQVEEVATIWDSGNDGADSGLDADLLDGKQGSEYVKEPEDLYKEKEPKGQRIYVSSQYGNDNNFGFFPERPVKTIRQATINAFAVQAPDTTEGNIRKDAYRTLEANRELIVEEIGLIANAGQLCGPFRDARTYRDIDDLYGALAKDLLLSTNRNFRFTVGEIFDVGSIDSAWRTNIQDSVDGSLPDRSLFRHLVTLMWRSLYPSTFGSSLTILDFPYSSDLYGSDWVRDRLTPSTRDDTAINTRDLVSGTDNFPTEDDPCKFLRNELANKEFPNDRDSLETLQKPNQTNKKAFSVIRVEAGTYQERFPIELPDNVSVFGDSLRRVEILPRQDIRERGCGLHQRFLAETFTSLNTKGEFWNNSIIVRYDHVSEGVLPTTDSVFGGVTSIDGLKERSKGRMFRVTVLTNFGAPTGIVQELEVLDTYRGSEPAIKLNFGDTATEGMEEIPPLTTVSITDLDSDDGNGNFRTEETTFESHDLFRGYLLLKDNDDEPILTSAQDQVLERNTQVTPTLRFNNPPKFKLRKGDVLLLFSNSQNRLELIRIEDNQEDSDGNLTIINMVTHRLNEQFNLNDCFVYIAPRAEWQSECLSRSFENRFAQGQNDSLPSTEVVTNTAEVGQNAFYVGNANYVFQVVFKDTTNFAFTFRRDNPRIFASPYIQNCSSISTKGGAGILVDGFLPKQPDDDFPERIIDQETLDVFGSDSSASPAIDIERALNIHYDGENLIRRSQDDIVENTFSATTVTDRLSLLSDEEDNYDDIEKCKRDAHFLIDAVRWQMLRGGNDKAHDVAKVISFVMYLQTKDLTVPLESRNRVVNVYATVIDELWSRSKSAIDNAQESDDIPDGNCTLVKESLDRIFLTIKEVLVGFPHNVKYYDATQGLTWQIDVIVDQVMADSGVQTALGGLGDDSGYEGQIDKCRRDLRYLISAVAWNLSRRGNSSNSRVSNTKVYEVAEVVRQVLIDQSDSASGLTEVRDAYQVVINKLKYEVRNTIENLEDPTSGDCSEVTDDADFLLDSFLSHIREDSLMTVIEEIDTPRNNHVALPGVKLAKLQNSELRSFVLDAFTQINTFGGWGHLIRNNGYAQLVSTFTTFCDQGIKVESGGLINLSNSVSDFGFFGLVADGMSRTPYLLGRTYRTERGASPGKSPTTQIYVDPLQLAFNADNPVYQNRVDQELSDKANDYETLEQELIDLINSDNPDPTTIENKIVEVEQARRDLEKVATDAIQFNTTILFSLNGDGIYDFNREGTHLPQQRQVRRGVNYVDSVDNTSGDAISRFIKEEKEIGAYTITVPLIRVGFSTSERIPNAEDAGRDLKPILESGTEVLFYITTTLTSSSHGFEYVGSGNDYTNALPENGGVPEASKQLLETNGGRVFTSSTDVRGDFRVGNFFTVRQSTGEVIFNPSSLELVNLRSIGPFKSNGIVGNTIIRDLTNDFNELLRDSSSRDSSTIITVNGIKGALNKTFSALSNEVGIALQRSESNAKLLESVKNPIPDYGTWAGKHAIHHRSFQVDTGGSVREDGVNSETPWSVVRSLNSYLYELGAKVYDLVDDGSNEFRNRASFTLNMVIDSSESMSQSGNYSQIKQDLLNFFYNATDNDSFGLYQIKSSTLDKAYVTLNGINLLNQIQDASGTLTVDIFAVNNENVENIAYYDADAVSFSSGFYNESLSDTDPTLYKVGTAKVFDVVSLEEKLGLTDIKGYLAEDQVIVVTGTDENDDPIEIGRDVVNTVEFGLLPAIFNYANGTDLIRTNLPNFDFNRAMINGLVRELGVVLPTTSKIEEDGLLEIVTANEITQPPDFPGINIAPGPDDWTSDSGTIWQNEDNGDPFSETDVDGTSIDLNYDYANDSTRDNSNWFYGDVDPDSNESSNVQSKFKYLPPRSSVSGDNAVDYEIDSISTFSKYKSDSNQDGWLTPSEITNNNFLREQKSTPLLDVAVTTHSGWFGFHNALDQARAMRNFMTELDVLGIFDWKVAKLSFRAGVDQKLRIRDFYEEDPSEDPRRNIFSASAANWRWGHDREVTSGISASEGILVLENLQFAPDDSGSIDKTNSAGTTLASGVEGDNTFWIGLSQNAEAPIHAGTEIQLRDRGATVGVTLNGLGLTDNIDEIELINPQQRLGTDDSVTVRIASRESGQRHSFEYVFSFTVDGTVNPNDSNVWVSISGGESGIWGLIGVDTSQDANSWGDGYRTSGTLGERLSAATQSGDEHPLFDYNSLAYDKEWNEDTQQYEDVSRSYDFTSRTRATVSNGSLTCTVEDVRYDSDRIWIKVNTSDWAKSSGVNKSFGHTRSDIKITHNDLTLYIDPSVGSRQSKSRFGSTQKAISDTCIELNWRRNSYKVINVVSRYPSQFENPHVGGYYYAFNSSLSLRNRVLLRRFDYVYLKYKLSNVNEMFEGEGLDTAFSILEDSVDTTVQFPYNNSGSLYNDNDFEAFIDDLSQVLMDNGAPVHAWYLGHINDESGSQITEDVEDENGNTITLSAERGTVSRNGSLIKKSNGFELYRLEDYASYSAVQEDLIFAKIDQLNLATRSGVYYQDDLFSAPEGLSLGSLFNFHNPTNFNEPAVNNILIHRTGSDGFDAISTLDRDSGSGTNYDGSDVNNDFTNQWLEKTKTLPFGQWRYVEEIKNSNWLKTLVTEIEAALGEGNGVLYSEFGNDLGEISIENKAELPPGYREVISDTDTFGEFDGNGNLIEPGYTDSDGNLIKSPSPAILPSPSFDKNLLASAPNSSVSPGITLKGRSAVYESILVSMKDSSDRDVKLLDNNPKVDTQPRNPARSGTINITGVVSDGLDNDSFDSLVVRHFISYDSSGKVGITETLVNLFYELFLDANNNIQLDSNGAPIQQKYIYTSEILNTLHILSFALAGGNDETEVFVNTGSGFGDNGNNYDLPFQIETANGVLTNTGNLPNIRRMTETSDNDFDLVDAMGLIPPFYRSSTDAIPGLVPANVTDKGEIKFSDLFPNPYRFVPYSFSVSESKQSETRDLSNLPEEAKVFTNIGEEGPNISFDINVATLSVGNDLILNKVLGQEERVITLPERVTVNLYSKLGYFHQVSPDRRSGIASQLIVFDTGFGQKVSTESQVLAQNLGGTGGTPFNSPGTIVSEEQDEGFVKRDSDTGKIEYTQNPGETLVDQRFNYINNAFETSAESLFTPGVPLISRRYLGTQLSGEYADALKEVNGDLYLSKVDTNRNNRNGIFKFGTSSETWSQEVGNQLRTAGKQLEIFDFTTIEFDGSPSPVAILRDKELNDSKILVLNNDVWTTLIDTNTLVHDPLSDPNREFPEPINLQSRDFFLGIVQVSDGAEDPTFHTHIAIKQGTGGRVISTQDYLDPFNLRQKAIRWQVSNYDIQDIFNSRKEMDFSLLELEEGELTRNSVFGLKDGTEFEGLYKFDFDKSLDINDYDSTIDPDNDPGGDFWLTANSQNNMFSNGGPLFEFPEETITLDFHPLDTSPGYSWSIMTVIGDRTKDGNEYDRYPSNSESDETFIYSPGTGVYLYEDGDNPLLSSGGRNRLDTVRIEANGTSGAWKKLSQFNSSSTISATSLSELLFEPSQFINGFDIVPTGSNDHLVALKADPSIPTETRLYVADALTLTKDPDSEDNLPSTTWKAINDGDTFVRKNNDGDDIALPTSGSDIGETIASKTVKTSTGDFLVVLFTNKATLGSTGNMIAVVPLPLSQPVEDMDWGIYTVADYKVDEGTSTEFIFKNIFPLDSNRVVLDVESGTGEKALDILSIAYNDTDGFTFTYEANRLTQQDILDEGILSTAYDNDLSNNEETNFFSGVTNYTYNSTDYLFIALSSPNTNKSVVIRSNLSLDNTSLTTMNQDGATNDNISYTPLTDPQSYPRYPHGENWLRDGAIGVNQGLFVASHDANPEEDFRWNAVRYQTNDLFGTIREVVDNYKSAI